MKRVCASIRGPAEKRAALFVLSLVLAFLFTPTIPLSAAPTEKAGRARLILVFVLDGLRPDSINPDDTPNLYRLREEGVNYLNGHAVFPTVTRVNSAAMSTGSYPGTNGLVSNSMYVPEVHPNRAFSTGDFENLLKLDEVSGGRMLFVKSLGEILQERGLRLAAVSSGSTGSALLLNPRAPQGVGVLVNGYFDPGTLVAFPSEVNAEILARFGAAPPKGGRLDLFNAPVDWAEEVLREYLLPDLRPDVVFNWLTEPDHTQHAFGAGSPEARDTIRNDDRNIGLILEKLKALGLENRTDIFVVSDHGFSLQTFGVNVAQALIDAGLKAGRDSDDVVVASSGQSVLLHVKGRDPDRIQAIVRFLQAQEWIGVLFTASERPGEERGAGLSGKEKKSAEPEGWVDGTFSLELIHEFNPERGPDLLLTFPWTSEKNRFGVKGTDYTNTGGATGPLTGTGSGHGGISPWTVRNTFIAWGVDFKRGVTLQTPASNVDLAPTILALKGIEWEGPMGGRVLIEALKKGPEEDDVPVETKTLTVEGEGGRYRAAIQITEVGDQRYIDQGRRIP